MDKSETGLSQTLPSGTCLHGTYIIDEILGKGGFGITYSGYHQETKERVAIKEYHPSECSDETEENNRRRFLQEAELLQTYRDLDCIVSLYDFFEEGSSAYLVMEYIEGPTLEQFICENGTLTFSELFDLIQPLIHSLNVIHKDGLLHRDISPDNLILGMDNQLHLIDFGAAGMNNIGKKHHNTVILKNGYAPPEQYLAMGNQGPWSDVYALCATMYFALTGSAPSPSISRLHEDSVKPLSMVADISPGISAVIGKGLQIHPADRFRDMEELSTALNSPETMEKNPTVSIRRIPFSLRIRLWRHHRHYKSFAALTVLLFVLAAGLFLLGRQPSETPVSQKTAPATVSGSDSSAMVVTTSPVSDTSGMAVSTSAVSPELLEMINVKGMSVKKAKKQLAKLDNSIKVYTKTAYDKKKTSGKIISQSVASKTVFTKGQIKSITLTVSKGARPDSKDTAEKTSKPTSSPEPTFEVLPDEEEDYATVPLN
jgi:serine/threonine protein kinase